LIVYSQVYIEMTSANQIVVLRPE